MTTKMNLDEVRKVLRSSGAEISAETLMANNRGIRLDIKGGAIVNVFKTGKISFQGQDAGTIEKLFDVSQESQPRSRKVFVVYGHNEDAKRDAELMIRRFDLEPIILDQLPSEGTTIIEKLENYTENIGFGIVLATPDDEAYRRGHPDEKAFRARQNVVLELGILLNSLGRSRVAILMKEQVNMERPSDIQGLIYIPFKEKIDEAQVALAKEMTAQGYTINVRQLK